MPRSTFILVPGAWHGGWAWWPVAERLRAAGHPTECLTLPGLAHGADPAGHRLADAADHLADRLSRHPGPTVVVGHSWAGYPILQALPRITTATRIVYYNAQIPVPGRSLIDDNPDENAHLLRRAIAESEYGAIPPLFDYVEQLFLQDVAPDLQRFVASLLTAQPGHYFSDPYDGADPRTSNVDCTYLLSEDDRALQWPGEQFAARLGVEPVPVPGTHDSLLTHPDELAQAILQLGE